MGRDRVRWGLRRGDGEDRRDRDLCQPQQLGVFDVYWTDGGFRSGLIETIHQEEDVSTPDDLSGGVE